MFPHKVTEKELALYTDKALSAVRMREVGAHLDGCVTCQAQVNAFETLIRDLQAAPPVSTPRVDTRPTKLVKAPTPQRSHAAQRLALWGALAASALMAIVALRDSPMSTKGVRLKGAAGSDAERWTGIQVYRVEDDQAIALVASESLRADAPLVFSYVNHSAHPFAYLMIFACDARGAVHWYYPAHMHPNDDPTSIHIDAVHEPRALPEQVRHPIASGPLTLRALFSRQPLRVRAVEAALAGRCEEIALVSDGTAGIEQILHFEAR